jgi:hypothetical protein
MLNEFRRDLERRCCDAERLIDEASDLMDDMLPEAGKSVVLPDPLAQIHHVELQKI